MVISTKEELEFLIHRSWEIEKNFELLSIWEGFVSVGVIHRKTLLKLAKDSQKHKLDLEKLFEILNLEYPKIMIPRQSFDFENMLDIEILQKIIKNDEAVLDLYSEIFEKTDPKLIASLSGRKNTDFFFNIFDKLIEDEKRHVNIVRTITGTITRIQ